jgi:hypothetical protein
MSHTLTDCLNSNPKLMLNPVVRRRLELNGIEGVSAGGVATIPVTTGESYDQFKLRYSESGSLADVLTSGIDRVRAVVDGKTIHDLTASQTLDLCLINGHTVKTGELPIFYTQPSRASVADEEFTMLDLSNFGAAHLLVNVNGSATSPSLKALAETSLKPARRNEGGMQIVPHREAFNFTFGGNGTFDISTLPKGVDISRLFFYYSGTSIDHVELTVDETVQQDLSTDENDSFLRDRGFTPQNTNIDYPIVFDIDQKASSTIRALRKLLAKVTVTGAGQCVVVVESMIQLK